MFYVYPYLDVGEDMSCRSQDYCHKEIESLANDKHYQVVYASDDRFSEIMGVSIVSLFEKNRDADTICLYILDTNISGENKSRIEQICKNYKRPLPIWIPAINIEKKLQMQILIDRGSLSQYARLFLSSLLPDGIDRVLYLDCDIIIHQSINELWNLNLNGNTIGALKDAFSRYYRANVDLQPKDIMFNSGVMLVDLTLWKMRDTENRLMQFIYAHKGKIQQGDQGALNAVLSHEVFCFEPRFNAVTIFFDFTYKEMLIYRKPVDFYSEIEVEAARENPVLIHFTTSFLSKRPWERGCHHRYTSVWYANKKLSPWKDSPVWESTGPKWRRISKKIFVAMPKALTIRIAGFLQVYIRPLKNRVFY